MSAHPKNVGRVPSRGGSTEGAKESDSRVVPLGKVVDFNPRLGKDELADDSLASFIPMKCVEKESGRFEPLGDRKVAEVRKGYTPFRDGDVIFAKVTPCMENGKAAVLKGLTNGVGFGSTEFFALRPKNGLEAKYLFHFILQSNFRRDAARNMTGAVGLRRVPKSYLEQQTIPLPNPDQQRRIVAEIEKQFTRLEAGLAALRRVQANLKRYRAAVLKAACEGRLVPSDLSAWKRLKVSEIGEAVTGNTPPTSDKENLGDELPFFKPTDLDAGYNVREARQYLSAKGAKHARVLPAGAVLVTCIGATIGKTGFARVDCATNQQINAFVANPKVATPEWAFWLFSSPVGQQQIKSNASATTLPILNKSKCEALEFPIPPLAEQTRIVAEVERRLSVVEEMEVVVSANLQRASGLRQSILQKAFTGQLT
jgi:type I restriction enzyme S subunit